MKFLSAVFAAVGFLASAAVGTASTSISDPAAPSAVAPTAPPTTLTTGGLNLTLYQTTGTVASLNISVHASTGFGAQNNFSFVPKSAPRRGCHNLGDITLRVRVAGTKSFFSYFSSASADGTAAAIPLSTSGSVLTAYDLSPLLNLTKAAENGEDNDPNHFGGSPIRVVRLIEKSAHGFTLRFNLSNTASEAIEIGGLGFAMPSAGQQSTIQQSVWHDPYVGLDHGFVEWTRVVDGEQVLLAVPDQSSSTPFEAWRPIMENTCGSDTWEYDVHSMAWADDWAKTVQWPYLYMAADLNATRMWPNPTTPWPSWSVGHDTVPITKTTPFNTPTSLTLKKDEAVSYALRFILAEAGPRTRDAALADAGIAVMQGVPGYVLSPEMRTAKLFVSGVDVASVASSDDSILAVGNPAKGKMTTIPLSPQGPGKCTLTVTFTDGSRAAVHYSVLDAFPDVVAKLGQHWANDAWLPRNYSDPFGRSASVMPYDRELKTWVLDDARAYDVGLSDDAGGGNPLGFAIKTAFAPVAEEVERLDEFIKWTLYGVKPDTAKPPLKSLQIRYGEPGMEGAADGIRMTMYYYDNASHPSPNSSGHFAYDYKMQDHCGLDGIEGGPNWCMDEGNANATYRVFNFPHHTASYYAMYRVARYHSNIKTEKTWQWYLARAANTTIKFGAPTVGVMDGTIFREVLARLKEEAGADPSSQEGRFFATAASTIEANMRTRAASFASKEYPYGSEFAFDTTGQEEVVVWLMHFAGQEGGKANYTAAAKRTVDHILSYMRTFPSWAYNGASRSWGDLGNNGKWMVSKSTASNFQTRGNFHYRSGLNQIPLIEWYRANPDDLLLLRIAMGAQAGQLTNVDSETGAPSMMLHMLPHVLEFDPHSGDYGLGFFGISLETGSYFVDDADMGELCFQCELAASSTSAALATTTAAASAPTTTTTTSSTSVTPTTFSPTDAYRQRSFIEPLALYLEADAGRFKTISIDAKAKRVTIQFEPEPKVSRTFENRRLRLTKTSDARPGSGFKVTLPEGAVVRGAAWEFSADVSTAVVSWQ